MGNSGGGLWVGASQALRAAPVASQAGLLSSSPASARLGQAPTSPRRSGASRAEADVGGRRSRRPTRRAAVEDTDRRRRLAAPAWHPGDHSRHARSDAAHRPAGRAAPQGGTPGARASVSSRLVRAASGRAIAVEVTVPSAGLEHGHLFRVLGDELRRPSGFGFTGEPTGRPPLPEETASVHRHVGRVETVARAWTDAHRAEARRLQAEGLSGRRSRSRCAATSGTSRPWERGCAGRLLPAMAKS